MKSSIKSSNKGWIFAFWFYLALILTISISAYLKLLPSQLSKIPYYDIIGHCVLIGMAAFLAHLALKKRRVTFFNVSIPVAPIIVSFCCIVDELLQTLSPNRSPSAIDLIADFIGIAVFYWLAERVRLQNAPKTDAKRLQ